MEIAEEIDAAGLLCPLPVLRLRKRLAALPQGAVVRLLATDPAAWVDVPHFCAEAGHDLLSAAEEDGRAVYTVRRGPSRGERAAG
jgi:tRNA 2-thiouridine synthesizing protein A